MKELGDFFSSPAKVFIGSKNHHRNRGARHYLDKGNEESRIDIVPTNNKDLTVYSPINGSVRKIISNNKCGKGAILRNNKYHIGLCHLDSLYVNENDEVDRGDKIGVMGNTGNAYNTGKHLHVTIKRKKGDVYVTDKGAEARKTFDKYIKAEPNVFEGENFMVASLLFLGVVLVIISI